MITQNDIAFDRLVRDLIDQMPGYNLRDKGTDYIAVHEHGHGLRFVDGDGRFEPTADRGRLIVIPLETVGRDGYDYKPLRSGGMRVSKTKSHKIILADIQRRAIVPLLARLDHLNKVNARIQELAGQAYQAAETSLEHLEGWGVEAMRTRPTTARTVPADVRLVNRTSADNVDPDSDPLDVGAFFLRVSLVVDVETGPAFTAALRRFLDSRPWECPTSAPDATSESETSAEIALVDEGTLFEASLFINGQPVPAEVYAVDANADLEFVERAVPPISPACAAQLEQYLADAVTHAEGL